MKIEINQIPSTYKITFTKESWTEPNNLAGMMLGFKKIKF